MSDSPYTNRIWQKSYAPGLPYEIDMSKLRSINQMLRDFGLRNPFRNLNRDLRMLVSALREKLPPRHIEFLRNLGLHHIEGGYLFVHAGIAPGRPIEKQRSEDLLWIRDDFLRSTADHGYCVVHGHTITEQPEFCENRIGIDTGACYNGNLTCVVLEGANKRFLSTSEAESYLERVASL